MLQTIRALYNFLQSNNIPLKGVSVTIEFDNYDAAARASYWIRRELDPRVRDFDARDAPAIVDACIMDIPVKLVAKI